MEIPVILLDTGLSGPTGMQNADLTTLTQNAVHSWRLQSEVRRTSKSPKKKIEIFLGLRRRPTRLMSCPDSSESHSRPSKFSLLNSDNVLSESWKPPIHPWRKGGRLPPMLSYIEHHGPFKATERLPLGAVIILRRLFVSLSFYSWFYPHSGRFLHFIKAFSHRLSSPVNLTIAL